MKRRHFLLALMALAARLGWPQRANAGEEEQEIYSRAIAWLVAKQHENGSFGQIPNQEPGELGITGLVVKALAGAPEPHRKRHRAAIDKAAAWVLQHQREDGSFVQGRSGMVTYRTAIAITALSAVDRVQHRRAIEKASAWLKGSQVGEGGGVAQDDPHHGGFGYGRDGKPNTDLSNTQMALAALRDAGIASDDPVFKRALVFLSRCQNNSETNPGVAGLKPLNDGGFLYGSTPERNKNATENEDGTKSFRSYASMTYAGLMSLVYAGLKDDDPRLKAAKSWISAHYTLEENYGMGVRAKDPRAGQQGLYYYFHSFARCLAALGDKTIKTKQGNRVWARDLFAAFKARQKPKGFFINEESRWWERDPVLCTAFVVNAMNYAFPFLPSEAKDKR